MLDVGDPAFKLFGERIPLPADGAVVPGFSAEGLSGDSDDNGTSDSDRTAEEMEAEYEAEKGQAEKQSTKETAIQEDPPPVPAIEKEENHQNVSKATSEDQSTPNCLDENSADEAQKDDEKPQSEESKNLKEKTIKKPDKILPCPRCNSMDTKFCYYNNYNVNQPRHFCKSCQRYWTAGGTMRNVPVGAGRRKNKSASSRYCQISISEALQAAHTHIDLPNSVHHTRQQPESGLKINGTVLTFGADSPLCESMATMMNLAEKNVLNGTGNGFQVQCRNGENGDDRSSGSSTITMSTSREQGGLKGGGSSNNQIPQNINGFTGHQVPCFPGFQMAYGWNPAVPLPPPPPGYFPSAGFPPMPFFPAPFWNGAPIPWNIPWVSPCSLSPKSPGSNASSPTLGKHSRDEDTLNPSSEALKSSGSSQVLVPKTLRIDDPEEAAKSSIWTTLGIKKVEPAGNGGFFKGLQSKGEEKNRKMENFPALNANPAAVARSISFQETA